MENYGNKYGKKNGLKWFRPQLSPRILPFLCACISEALRCVAQEALQMPGMSMCTSVQASSESKLEAGKVGRSTTSMTGVGLLKIWYQKNPKNLMEFG